MIQESVRPVILHVTESFGGGVATALAQYALSTPELEHHLLMGEREGDFSDNGELALFRSVRNLPNQPLGAIGTIRNRIQELNPDIVHAHSSFAGAYVRVSKRATKSLRIVYTPHGYSFERKDLNRLKRRIFMVIEGALSLNTSVTAACSPRELELSHDLTDAAASVYVPNVANDVSEISTGILKHSRETATLRITAVGRLTAARDPRFFLDTIRILRKKNFKVDASWIGGGEKVYIQELEAEGIPVTGWLDRGKVMESLSRADLHLHTAAWDAFPMVLLEANALRIPSLVRSIDAFSSVTDSLKAATPSDMAQKVAHLAQNRDELETTLALWDTALVDNTRTIQRNRLRTAYGLTTETDS